MPYRRQRSVAAGVAGAALAAAGVLVPIADAEPAADYPTDEQGYTGTAARCDDSQTVVEFGRTSRALVAICVDPDGQLEYRGVRLSDQAGLTMPATRAPDGTITATNDGVTYAVSPQMILVSEGDTVIYRSSWTEFREPSFSGGTPGPSATTTPTTAAGPSAADSTPSSTSPTVRTTTVTLSPESR